MNPLPPPPDPQQRYANMNAGYVYVMEVVGTGAHKIGVSINLAQRLHTLQRGKTYKLECICHVWSQDAYQLEFQLQRRFKERHLSGEWFALTPEDIELIRGLAT